MKRLVGRENSYEFPNSPNPGPWGQYLKFDDGSVEFDAGHAQSAEIQRVTTSIAGSPATFVPGLIGKNEAGNWVA